MTTLRFRGQNSLHDSIVDTNEEYMVECWHAAHACDPSLAERISIGFSAAGCAHAIERWLFEGCADDPDEVVSAICACIPKAVLETLY